MTDYIIEYETAIGSGTLADTDLLRVYDSSAKAYRSATLGNVRELLASGPVNLTAATLALTAATHGGKTVTVNRAAGATITLPASSGSGAKFKVYIGTTLSSGSLVVQVANSTDVFQGQVQTMSDDPATVKAFATTASSDTITLNRTTTGVGTAGEWLTFEDVASGFWGVFGVTTSSGTEATPFSAAV